MKYILSNIPERAKKTRDNGLTMVMDKGLSLRQVEDLIEAEDLIDIIKLGFGTPYISKNLHEKIALYRKANIKVHFGGTLFEAFYVRNKLEDYLKLLNEYQLDTIEISDGSIQLEHETKCEIIQKLTREFTVLSEVGSKDESILLSPDKWIKMMENELIAGSWKVIAEARESGTVGIYGSDGHAHIDLISKIIGNISQEKILWEAPKKNQQTYFIKLLGSNVNLGNIAPIDLIPLETLRLGLRGDTFFEFLPKEMK
jgi:phosphosulfolactate synthase